MASIAIEYNLKRWNQGKILTDDGVAEEKKCDMSLFEIFREQPESRNIEKMSKREEKLHKTVDHTREINDQMAHILE